MPPLSFEELCKHFQLLWTPYKGEGWIGAVTREGLHLFRYWESDDLWHLVTTAQAVKDDIIEMPYRTLIKEFGDFLHRTRFPVY